ncbi:DUF3995 domain-containing protein [Crocinitomix algicola]|uniref:DUF3995 domain-containing protein n=1 Tax=Crocinitomix algicola TaxID=1740263 RepID=UPI00083692DB|nr:DUF3995 domain-containing protein [Crocinitomix algicola]
MISILTAVLATIFFVLSIIHFYWLFGGKKGLASAIPTKNNRSKPVAIPHFATLIVALGLGFFGLLYLSRFIDITLPLPNFIQKFSYWTIPTLFILRAIGDFNYVGIFKKIKSTPFAKADAKWFVPLCIIIAVIGFLTQLFHLVRV